MDLIKRVQNKVLYTVNSSLTNSDADKWAAEEKAKQEAAATAAADAANKEAENQKAAADSAAASKKLQYQKNYGTKDIVKTALNTFIYTLVIIGIIALSLYAGSLVANDGIARSTSYRVLYFIYGAIPSISIGVLIYYHIYRRYKATFPQLFTFLPLKEVPDISVLNPSWFQKLYTFSTNNPAYENKTNELKAMWDAAATVVGA